MDCVILLKKVSNNPDVFNSRLIWGEPEAEEEWVDMDDDYVP